MKKIRAIKIMKSFSLCIYLRIFTKLYSGLIHRKKHEQIFRKSFVKSP